MKSTHSRAELGHSIRHEAADLVLGAALLFIAAGSLWAHFALGGLFLEPALLTCWFLMHGTGFLALRWRRLEVPMALLAFFTLQLYFHVSFNRLEIPFLPTAPLFFLISALSLTAYRSQRPWLFALAWLAAWTSAYIWLQSVTDGDTAHAMNMAYFFALGVNVFFILLFFVASEMFKRRLLTRFELLGPRQTFDDQRLHAAKLQTLGELAASLVHEINNPLSSINGYSHQIRCELVENSPPDVSVLQAANDRIKSNVDRIIEISKALRSFSRKPSAEDFSPVSLNEVLKDSLVLVTASYKIEKVDLQLDVPSEPVLVRGNFVQLSQVLVNLLTNARDAVGKSDRKKVSTGAYVRGDKVCLWVEDTGPGISEGDAGDVFKAFYTTKDAGKGTGLGLYISQMIAERHHAELRFFTTRDPAGRIRGTRFELWIPALAAARGSQAA